ncbi:piggyBac transposable element-derived protein 3-like [Anthonomus grandis grandis]|uniref:piggyBac transposable element-derived protein 3-like n=1 Tax=Anthonomus grandis grandis TaxID=2921223 RepID=UPI0021652BF3|nr:piggyBac transposable element-derived protein 3-like [Anthonomus grandis grandis]
MVHVFNAEYSTVAEWAEEKEALEMDPKIFYGINSKYVRDVPEDNESDVPDLSNDEDNNIPINHHNILAYESDDSMPEGDYDETTIPETDVESAKSENMTLQEIAEKINPGSWRTGNLRKDPKELEFTGNLNMPPEVADLETPSEFFKFFLTNEIISTITTELNLYCLQKHINRPANLTDNEIEQFIGMYLYMSIIQLPQARNYWSSHLGHPAISRVMTCNRWEEIKRFIHFNNNDNFIPRGKPGHDKLFKIRPLLERLQERLNIIPVEEHIAVDELIIPTKARSTIKQYNPKKPHKWGFKVFVLSGISGFSYSFDIFAGSQSNIVPADAPDLGTSSNVVVKFVERVPKHENHKIFFDNWFTSVPLMVYLTKNGIHPLGTVHLNRVQGCKMLSEKEFKKLGRGSWQEKTAIKDDVKPTGTKQRFFRSEKCYKNVECPQTILKYNEYMGGVDLLGSMLGYYCIKIRSKKWYLRIFFHFMDMCVVNNFKVAIADALCNSGKSVLTRKRGRPSANLENAYLQKKKRGPTTEIPQTEVRKDGIDHFSEWRENDRNRC